MATMAMLPATVPLLASRGSLTACHSYACCPRARLLLSDHCLKPVRAPMSTLQHTQLKQPTHRVSSWHGRCARCPGRRMEPLTADTAAEDTQPDWLSLPASALQHIIRLASAWQAPGTCWVAPVCRTWRAAAAGCRNMSLLYRAGQRARDKSFASWLAHNSHKVVGLIIISAHLITNVDRILSTLAKASEAAAAKGRHLPLHTLRVLANHSPPSWAVIGRLLASLPNLRTLQMDSMSYPLKLLGGQWSIPADAQQPLASLQHATQLQELYMRVPGHNYVLNWLGHHTPDCGPAFAALLPPSLRRLGWQLGTPLDGQLPLSHLTQLSFLQLQATGLVPLSSDSLADSAQEVELVDTSVDLGQLLEQQQQQKQQLIGYDSRSPSLRSSPIGQFLKLRSITVYNHELQDPAVCADLLRLSKLAALTCKQPAGTGEGSDSSSERIVGLASSLSSLCSLHLMGVQVNAGVAALTRLTRLVVCTHQGNCSWLPSNRRYVAEICVQPEALGHLASLKWLSVPEGLLQPGQVWLPQLQQLQVLVVQDTRQESAGDDVPAEGMSAEGVQPDVHVAWLEGCCPQVLPPHLRVLALTGMTPLKAAAWGQRHRLRELLGSSGCEVVVGVDLDEVGDPVKQLAGWPEGLRQGLL